MADHEMTYSQIYQVSLKEWPDGSRSVPPSTRRDDQNKRASEKGVLTNPLGSISPSVMVPEHRLAVLLDQIKQTQISKCLYHNPSTSPSLFEDHMCDRSQFPLRTILELAQNPDEVYCVEFSHDGTRLATCGKGNIVIIYDATTFQVRHQLQEHTDIVSYLTWSPDDSKLITCSRDKMARVWNMDVSNLSRRLFPGGPYVIASLVGGSCSKTSNHISHRSYLNATNVGYRLAKAYL